MPLVPAHRPGNLHKTAVQLFAPDPTWTKPGSATAVVVASPGGSGTVNLVYSGDMPEYPVITLKGALTNPVLTNVTTGEVLTFAGTISAAQTYTIDLRYGRKTVTRQDGTNKIGELADASDLATWRLEPAPIAAGGTNVITLTGYVSGDGVGTIIYYNRYSSW